MNTNLIGLKEIAKDVMAVITSYTDQSTIRRPRYTQRQSLKQCTSSEHLSIHYRNIQN